MCGVPKFHPDLHPYNQNEVYRLIGGGGGAIVSLNLLQVNLPHM
jgi:hypothetical protein